VFVNTFITNDFYDKQHVMDATNSEYLQFCVNCTALTYTIT